MPTQISLHDITKSYGDRPLLDGVSLSVRPGERVGIVGENGAGKSTLLRILAGAERPDEGQVVLRADGGVGYLGQTPDLPPDRTVQDAIDAALAEHREMERRLRSLERELDRATPAGLEEYGDLLTVFELRGGYEADARVDRALHALGLARLGHDRRLGSLSGGEQARLGIACLIAAAPEIMLLDEPTNHLDATALDWLEGALLAHRGTVLTVSHDRLFLQRIATALVEVDADRRSLVRYGGGYGTFITAKDAARRRWEQDHAQWCEQITQLTDFAGGAARSVARGRPMKDGNKMAYDRDRGRVQASVSSRVRNAQERLRRLRENPVPRPPDPLRFRAAPDVGEAEGTLVRLDGVRVEDRLAVDSLTVAAGERLLIHGANGAGKTTLLRVLAGLTTPDRGTVLRRGRIGFLAQEIPVSRPAEPLLTVFRRGLAGDVEELTALLLSFGLFRERDLHVPVGALSAGQRRRLALARLLARPADLLLLDEPTNHLALGLVEELEDALSAWPGALVVVSHDRLLRRRFSGRSYEICDGRPALSAH
ncbi:ATP-binding cassette domain-containing protein [Streptomyces sp. Je 1-4]|uniref:ABC-F family ATP-binding cassette domain-containing protein n=1 Tax=Streptomyces TaxID=1883 RepID=UPI0021D88EBA|nr:MULTISPECIES: ABC-F family ATP-binding cassette domain-containing protein [unclassified Streptomyces]UYB39553.1 ATP-binding cassette domain-containing protein [Streptomyces sp. Je 1-4]UZQ35593.1 ATP-binding cassette domain-containing protein [Streptomyces sp. Je 1-4] [Streptomyces sp. Je 1-4 4N24]UZQ43011.1 ATP-binding cassette domain-containing protein [Streptomyces sp. Je 1-4] [Streptomyces sp. Je 1-4 4N24_ara]